MWIFPKGCLSMGILRIGMYCGLEDSRRKHISPDIPALTRVISNKIQFSVSILPYGMNKTLVIKPTTAVKYSTSGFAWVWNGKKTLPKKLVDFIHNK